MISVRIMTTIAPQTKNIISLRSTIRLNTLKIKKAQEAQIKAQEAIARAQEEIVRSQQEIAIAEERRSQAEEDLKAFEEVIDEKHVVIFSTKGAEGYTDQLVRKGKKRFVQWEGQKSHAQDHLVLEAKGPVHFFHRNRRGKPFTYQGIVKKSSIQLIESGIPKQTPNTYQFELEMGMVPTGTIYSQVLRFNNKKDWHKTAAHGLGLKLEGYNSYFVRGIYETSFLQSTPTPSEQVSTNDSSEADTSETLSEENYDSDLSDSLEPGMEVLVDDVPKQPKFFKLIIFFMISILVVNTIAKAFRPDSDHWINDRARIINAALDWRDWVSALITNATAEGKAWFYNSTIPNKENITIIFNTTCHGITRNPSCQW